MSADLQNVNSLRAANEEYSELINTQTMQNIHVQVVFSPGESIRTWDRIMNLQTTEDFQNRKEITRGRFIRILSSKYRERKIDTETVSDRAEVASFTREVVVTNGVAHTEIVLPEYIKYAKHSADELADAYKNRGLVVLTPLAGLKLDALIMIEKLIFPLDKNEQVMVPETLIEFADLITDLELRDFKGNASVKDTVRETIRLMSQAIAQAITYQSDITSRLETELYNRRHSQGATGVQMLDEKTKHYFKMLKRVPQDQHLSNISERANAALINTIDNPIVETASGAKCPLCAANISLNTVKCPSCHEWIDTNAEIEWNRKRNAAKSDSRKQK